MNPRLIAFYLPQFHPIPENDNWWGRGFTEWTNVTRARPRFRGHAQPQLPADLGFYDLRTPESRAAQAELARSYGIDGFCYYHYWFNGRRLLERPFNEVLESGKPDFPFCLCWANESWTRAWDGQEKELLIKQEYSEADDLAHIRSLATVFSDARYLRVDGKPLFLIYRSSRLPQPERTTDTWRKEMRRLGVGELFLCRVESNFAEERSDPRPSGFDAAIEFQPDVLDFAGVLRQCFPPSVFSRVAKRLFNAAKWRLSRSAALLGYHAANDFIWDFGVFSEIMLRKPEPEYPRFPCVCPSWDNSSRRSHGAVIFKNASPLLYEQWLRTVLQRTRKRPPSEQIVFINAWNEWAEGCHLEPCQRWGRAYLEATQRAATIEQEGHNPS